MLNDVLRAIPTMRDRMVLLAPLRCRPASVITAPKIVPGASYLVSASLLYVDRSSLIVN